MLPQSFVMKLDVVHEKIVGVDLELPNGKPAPGLDASYPGFVECLGRLVEANLAFPIAEKFEGTKAKGRILRTFLVCRPTPPAPAAP